MAKMYQGYGNINIEGIMEMVYIAHSEATGMLY